MSLGIKTSIMLLAMSLSFIAIGVGLCLVTQTLGAVRESGAPLGLRPIVIRPYLDLGLRLIGSGTVALIATFSEILWEGERRPYVPIVSQ